MRFFTMFFSVLLIGIFSLVQADGPRTANLYVILLNGQPVTVDGDLSDWMDADFIYINQDAPNSAFYEGGQPTQSPADFGAHIAIKMDNDNIYFGANVRDEGGALIHDPYTEKNAGVMWQKDHLAFYLGLYDIGGRPSSPHLKVVDIIDPATGTVLQSGRTYRVKPGADNDPDGATLGPDFQMGVALQTYKETLANGAFHASNEKVINYNWGYVDTLIANTELAIKLWDDENGYSVEWKVPFASLAGFIARPTKPQAILEWPLFTPQDGAVIPFDVDITDEDRVGEFGANFLRYGPNPSLWRDSFGFGGRGIIRDASKIEKSNYCFVQHATDAGVTVDGDLTEWKNVQFIGMSQDSPNRGFYDGGQPTESPADFGVFAAIRMDPQNIYFAAKVRDEGGVLIHDPYTAKNAGTMWQKDHMAVYLGLFDIGDLAMSPHKNIVDIINTATGQVLQSGRTYRVRPGTDNDPDGATLGADFQMGVPIQSYTETLANGAYYAANEKAINYNWGYVDTLIANTEFAIKLWPDENGYDLEWKVPFASLAGFIARPTKPQSVLEWPLYTPEDGDVFPFDIDFTDEDRVGEFGSNFLRFGPNPSLWRDSFGFGLRGKVIATDTSHVITHVKEQVIGLTPNQFALKQNYPNPFNPSTTIEFDLAQSGPVKLSVYNLLGQKVATLVDSYLQPGAYRIQWEAVNLPNGVYIFRLQTNDRIEARRMLLMK